MGETIPQSKFKVGDKVKYVKGGRIGGETEPWGDEEGLILGNVYIVKLCWETAIMLTGFPTFKYIYHPDHFELVEAAMVSEPKGGNMDTNTLERLAVIFPKTKDAALILKWFDPCGNRWLLVDLQVHSTEYLVEAKRLEAEEKTSKAK